MKLLLHICCAPCLIYPLEALGKKGFQVSGYYYNPNISPDEEYLKRKQALVDYSLEQGLEVIYPQYLNSEFVSALNSCVEFPLRCRSCWQLRLMRTALFAREKGMDYFSTTLLVSPYQDHGLLKQIGNEVSLQTGVAFYYEDYRAGFYNARKIAKEKGIYRQKYCGCLYSESEQCKKPS